MGKRVWAGVLMGLLAASVAAQTVDDGQRALLDAVINKQMFLRGFDADSQMRWRWDGSSLVQQAPQIHTLAVLVVKSVKVKGNKVEIQGERHTLLRTSDTEYALSAGTDNVHLDVDLRNADVAKMLPQLSNLLFYPNMESALADLPDRYKGQLPASSAINCCSVTKQPLLKKCDCSDVTPSCDASGSQTVAGLTPPSVKQAEVASLSEEAQMAKMNGTVRVGLQIDERGRPIDLWIIKPFGFGLDEKAGESVSQYIFAPAMCHDKPIKVSMYIDVNFRVNSN
jgi:TonB family protein